MSKLELSSSNCLSMTQPVKSTWLDSPLGPILAIGDETALYLLEFSERKNLARGIEKLEQKIKSKIITGRTAPIDLVEQELKEYFLGQLTKFKTPFKILGSAFQIRVWEELQKIPHGKTLSYAQMALNIGKPSAFRAAALANGANQLALIIPCHRVINSNGELGGYGGGVARKKWLLHHEGKSRND